MPPCRVYAEKLPQFSGSLNLQTAQLLLEIVAEQGFSLAHTVAVLFVGGEVGFLRVRVAAVQRLRIGLGGGVDKSGAAQAFVALGLAGTLLNQDVIQVAGSLADAFF